MTRCHNEGMALGVLKEKKKFLFRVSGIFFLVFVLLFIGELKNGRGAFRKLAYSFLIGGSLSNLYDRGSRGYVVDYIRFDKKVPEKLKKIVFNLGDLFLLAGGLLLACKELLSEK